MWVDDQLSPRAKSVGGVAPLLFAGCGLEPAQNGITPSFFPARADILARVIGHFIEDAHPHAMPKAKRRVEFKLSHGGSAQALSSSDSNIGAAVDSKNRSAARFEKAAKLPRDSQGLGWHYPKNADRVPLAPIRVAPGQENDKGYRQDFPGVEPSASLPAERASWPGKASHPLTSAGGPRYLSDESGQSVLNSRRHFGRFIVCIRRSN